MFCMGWLKTTVHSVFCAGLGACIMWCFLSGEGLTGAIDRLCQVNERAAAPGEPGQSNLFAVAKAAPQEVPPQRGPLVPVQPERNRAAGAPVLARPFRAAPQQEGPVLLESYSPEELINIGVYEKCHRSVVNISAKTVQVQSLAFFDVEVPGEGAGSGFVIDRAGHIVTNYHVVEDAREIVATLNGETYEAELIGADPSSDVAVLKIAAPAAALTPLEWGDSRRLKEGQRVFAIGNPFGLERTLSEGIISSLNRSISSRDSVRRKIRNVIQMDLSINPGNSGGPLLDSAGRLIGMNTAIASVNGQSAGVGFAVPVSTIAHVVPQLIEQGRVIRPNHGIQKVSQTEQGLMVLTLEPGGPAEKAGLQGIRVIERRRQRAGFTYSTRQIDMASADLIIAVDGEKIENADEFLSLIDRKRPGETIRLTVVRAEKELVLPIILGADPG